MKGIYFLAVMLVSSCNWFDNFWGETFDSTPDYGVKVHNVSANSIVVGGYYDDGDSIIWQYRAIYNGAPYGGIPTDSIPPIWSLAVVEPGDTREFGMGIQSYFDDSRTKKWKSYGIVIAKQYSDIQEWARSQCDSLLLKKYSFSDDDFKMYSYWIPIDFER